MSVVEAIVAEEVRKNYRIGGSSVEALRGVSLTVSSGEVVALRGRSGSGKSTLLNVLGLLTRPDSGRLTLAGVDPMTLSAGAVADLRAARMGFVFQSFNLLPHLTALENITLASRKNERRAREVALALLERAGLAHRAKHRPSQLSGGEQQRVALVRALVNEPTVILADEPTGNLDAESEALVLDQLRKAAAEGCAVLIASHSDAVCASSDRVVAMANGVLTDVNGGTDVRGGQPSEW